MLAPHIDMSSDGMTCSAIALCAPAIVSTLLGSWIHPCCGLEHNYLRPAEGRTTHNWKSLIVFPAEQVCPRRLITLVRQTYGTLRDDISIIVLDVLPDARQWPDLIKGGKSSGSTGCFGGCFGYSLLLSFINEQSGSHGIVHFLNSLSCCPCPRQWPNLVRASKPTGSRGCFGGCFEYGLLYFLISMQQCLLNLVYSLILSHDVKRTCCLLMHLLRDTTVLLCGEDVSKACRGLMRFKPAFAAAEQSCIGQTSPYLTNLDIWRQQHHSCRHVLPRQVYS